MISLSEADRGVGEEIDELMTIIGVAPRDFAAARSNYEQLPAEEIHRRLVKFRVLRERLQTKLREGQKEETTTERMHFHPVIASDQPILTTTNVIEALAFVENVIEELRPNILVGINAEGMTVGNFVRQHMHLSARIIEASGTAGTGVNIVDARPVEAAPIVAVIGHAAKSGDTLIEVMQQATKVFQTDRVFGTILVASAHVADRLDKRSIYFHQKAEQFMDIFGLNAIECIETNNYYRSADRTINVVRREIGKISPPPSWTPSSGNRPAW